MFATSSFNLSPTAPSASQVKTATHRLTVLTDGLIRFESAPDGKFEDRASTFAINRDLPTPDFQLLRKEEGSIEIVTDRLHLLWDGKDFSPSSLHVLLRNKGESAWSPFDPFRI